MEPYALYYWPGIQGRGEFVRLVLEEADAPYVDVGRLPVEQGHSILSTHRFCQLFFPATPTEWSAYRFGRTTREPSVREQLLAPPVPWPTGRRRGWAAPAQRCLAIGSW